MLNPPYLRHSSLRENSTTELSKLKQKLHQNYSYTSNGISFKTVTVKLILKQNCGRLLVGVEDDLFAAEY